MNTYHELGRLEENVAEEFWKRNQDKRISSLTGIYTIFGESPYDNFKDFGRVDVSETVRDYLSDKISITDATNDIISAFDKYLWIDVNSVETSLLFVCNKWFLINDLDDDRYDLCVKFAFLKVAN